MYKLPLSFLLVIFSFIVHAQTVLYHENFELPGLDDSVTSTSTPSVGYVWNINTRLHSGTGSLRSDSCQVKAGNTVYLISQPFSTLGNSTVMLTFDQICKVDFLDVATLEVSNNNGTTWTQLTGAQYLGSGQYATNGNRFAVNSYGATWVPGSPSALPQNTWWKSETFDISTLTANAAAVMVRFKLMDGGTPGPNNNKGWYLDNLKVTGSGSELIPPVITLINPVLTGVQNLQGPYLVRAKATDASGIDTARIIYTVNGGPPDSIDMAPAGGDTVIVYLPAVSDSAVVCWYITATDASPNHNWARNPAAGCNSFTFYAGIPLPYTQSFDLNLNGWVPGYGGTVTTSSWQAGSPAYGATNSAHSAPTAWDVNLSTAYAINANCYLTSPNFDFSNASNASLAFWINYNTEPDYDGTRLDYSTDNGATWAVLGAVNSPGSTNWYNSVLSTTGKPAWNGTSGGWKQCSIPLLLFDSLSAQVRFRFVFSSDNSENVDGVSIDDFSILVPAVHEASLVSAVSPPLSGCGLGQQNVSILIRNSGGAAINGGLTASYRKAAWAPTVSEAVNAIFNPGDTLLFTFSTPVDLTATGADSTFILKTWISLAGDPDLNDDSLTRQVLSKDKPSAPVVSNQNIPHGTSTTLTAVCPGPVTWYNAPSGGLVLGTGNTLALPLVYATTVYYAGTVGSSGCQSERAPDTVFVGPAPPTDAALTTLLSPVSGKNLSPASPVRLRIRNYGQLPFSNFPLSFRLNNLPVVTETVPAVLQPGDSLTYTFAATVDLSGNATYMLKTWAGVSGDQNHLNDTLLRTIVCTPHSYCTSGSWASRTSIGQVRLAGLTQGNPLPVLNNPAINNHYTDYTGSIPPVLLRAGQQYPVSVSAIYESAYHNCSVRIVADWNNDGTFTTATETVFLSGPTTPTQTTLTGTFLVPPGAAQVYTRIRVVLEETSPPSNINPCGGYTYGETEDYLTLVLPAIDIDGKLTGLTSPAAILPEGSTSPVSVRLLNNGSQNLSQAGMGYILDNASPVLLPWTLNLATGDTASFSFPPFAWQAGQHTLNVFCVIPGDTAANNDSLFSTTTVIDVAPVPYFNDFTQPGEFWEEHAGLETRWIWGEAQPENWPYPVPSPSGVWATNLNLGGYRDNATCYLFSPGFLLTPYLHSYLSFRFNADFQIVGDGVTMEYSRNLGNSWSKLGSTGDASGHNWYNSSSLSGSWVTSSGKWKQARYNLGFLGGEPNPVLFRFRMISDNTHVKPGFALDDFEIRPSLPVDVAMEDVYLADELAVDSVCVVKCLARNLGESFFQQLTLGYRIDNQPAIYGTWSTLSGLEPPFFDTIRYAFPQSLTVPFGPFTLKVFTQLPGDNDTGNDTVTLQLFGKHPCQEVLAQADPFATSPTPGPGGVMAACPNSSVTFGGIGQYPENNLHYTQEDNSGVFRWDFGDGTSGTGQTVTHTYALPGEYTVYLTLLDANRCSSVKTEAARVDIPGSPLLSLPSGGGGCTGASLLLTAGTDSTDDIRYAPWQFYNVDEGAMVFDSAIYIPDPGGINLNCYQASIQVNNGNGPDTITDASQIQAVSVNMEHSYCGDLSLKITCPNGQSVLLKEYVNSGSAFLGIPYGGFNHDSWDCTYTPECGLDPLENPRGEGWTYTFSMDAVYDRMQLYAQNGNCLPPVPAGNKQMDSSSYLPYEPFTGLIGCPVNGAWTLEVCDYWDIDNGWVFWWKLALADPLMPHLSTYQVPVTSLAWSGPGILSSNNQQAQIQVYQPGEYTYGLLFTDSLGCQSDTTFNLLFTQGPAANPGPDQTFSAPATTIIYCNPSGGQAPYTVAWSSGGQGLSEMVTALVTTTYSVTVTDAAGCTALDSVTVTIGACPQLSGSLTYQNSVQTALNNVEAALYQGGLPLADTTTGLPGDFVFPGLCQPGPYEVRFQCSKPHGGANAVDALKVMQQFVGMVNLMPLQQKAADVDGSGLVNAVDALVIMKRFVGMLNSFDIGDWVFDAGQAEMLAGQSQILNLQALCAGDVDGSFVPGAKEAPAVVLETLPMLLPVIPGQVFELPFTANVTASYQALSLVLSYDPDRVRIREVIPASLRSDGRGRIFLSHVTGDEVRIAWIDGKGQDIPQEEPLFRIRMSLHNSREPLFVVAGGSAFADGEGRTLEGAVLLHPLTGSVESGWQLSLQPNPAGDEARLTGVFPGAGELEISLVESKGQELPLVSSMKVQEGAFSLALPVKNLPAGAYTLRCSFRSGQGWQLQNLRLIKL